MAHKTEGKWRSGFRRRRPSGPFRPDVPLDISQVVDFRGPKGRVGGKTRASARQLQSRRGVSPDRLAIQVRIANTPIARPPVVRSRAWSEFTGYRPRYSSLTGPNLMQRGILSNIAMLRRRITGEPG